MSYELASSTPNNWPSQDPYPDMTEQTEALEQLPGVQEGFQKESTFYFDNITILVENSLFRVPRHPFEQGSEVFRDMFQLPVGKGSTVDGCDDSHPLRLDQIKKEDFMQFLHRPFKQENLPATVAEWTSVLKLSTMWDFEAIRQAVIQQMSTIPIECVEKAFLALEYKVDGWLVPALNELARRVEPITLAEMGRLGPELTLKMAAVREDGREKTRVQTSVQTYCNNCGAFMHHTQNIPSNSIDFSSKIQEMLTRNL